MRKHKVMGGKPAAGSHWLRWVSMAEKEFKGWERFTKVLEALLSRCTLFTKCLILLKLPTSHTNLALLYCLINTIISAFV